MPDVAYFEIGPMYEEHWTGISNVVAAIAKCALADSDVDWRFFREAVEVRRDAVSEMLEEQSGLKERENFANRIWESRLLDYDDMRRSKAVFSNIKPLHNQFRSEAMFVYDLSPLLTPQFHNVHNIDHFANRFRADVESSQHFFPISEATRDDLETYFGVARLASTVVVMGVEFSLASLSIAQEIARSYRVEPYVVILGTLEPRKNGRLVLEYIARNPGFAHRYRIVYIGKDGWLNEREQLMSAVEAAGVQRDRVLFTGYVSEQEKVSLLYNSAFCIYASFFEGFGLPILEAAVLNKLIVCSNSSSMPEVAPDRCIFFDPSSIIEFSAAIAAAEKRAGHTKPSISLHEVRARLDQHSWGPCYHAIKDWVLS